MAGANPTELLNGRGQPSEQRAVVQGYVSTERPAPTAFPTPGSPANLLWIILPAYSLTTPFGPCQWNADHGATLPAQGASVVVNFDESNTPVVVWWEGARAAEPKPALASALPSEPGDGQEVYFQNTAMAEKGVAWHLRFRAASTEHKWEFVGGAALSTPGEGSITTESLVPVALTGGPTITLPLAGDYEISLYMYMQAAVEGLNELHGKVAVAGPGEFEFLREVVHQTFDGGMAYASQRVNGAGIKASVAVKVVNNVALKATYSTATLTARPIRVG